MTQNTVDSARSTSSPRAVAKVVEKGTPAPEATAAKVGPHISIKAEPIFHVGQFPVTNSFLLTTIVFVFFLGIVALYNYQAKKTKKGNFFYFVNFTMRSVYNLFESVFEERAAFFFPLIGAFFFFILLNNWSGLLPGIGSVLYQHTPLLRAGTTDLNTTISLALISVIYIQYLGITHLGFKDYSKKFIDFSSPVAFFVGILDIISEFSRLISFSFRLFGNIFAGEVLITVLAFLVPVLLSFPFLLFEVFIGIIQAFVFSMLSAVLFKLAITKQH